MAEGTVKFCIYERLESFSEGIIWRLITVGVVKHPGEKMQQSTMMNEVGRRIALRNLTEATITCRPYASTCTICASDGVMRNFSSEGSYIETSHEYKSGTILIMRMVRYPQIPSSVADEKQPRSICLAEVRWQKRLTDENTFRFGTGLRYLN